MVNLPYEFSQLSALKNGDHVEIWIMRGARVSVCLRRASETALLGKLRAPAGPKEWSPDGFKGGAMPAGFWHWRDVRPGDRLMVRVNWKTAFAGLLCYNHAHLGTVPKPSPLLDAIISRARR